MGRAEDILEKIIKDGEAAINEFILSRKSEELFLDFKRSADNGSGTKLNDIDREHLAKAISGFGNSEGGVIVWGIDCSKDKDHADVAHTKCPIKNVQRFVSWVEGVVSGCTVPPHTKVRHHYIALGDDGDGFVVTLIPKSDHAPHQVVVHGKSQYQYYIRAGSNFERTPHAVLAGMFGRRPQPHVFPMFSISEPEIIENNKIKINLEFLIGNGGPGIASDLFFNINVVSRPTNCKIFMKMVDIESWEVRSAFGVKWSAISKQHVRLAPDFFYEPFQLFVEIFSPFDKSLNFTCLCGCGSSPVYRSEFGNGAEKLQEMYEKFFIVVRTGIYTPEYGHNFIKEFLAVPKDEMFRNDR
jgi:hypothetical protein